MPLTAYFLILRQSFTASFKIERPCPEKKLRFLRPDSFKSQIFDQIDQRFFRNFRCRFVGFQGLLKLVGWCASCRTRSAFADGLSAAGTPRLPARRVGVASRCLERGARRKRTEVPGRGGGSLALRRQRPLDPTLPGILTSVLSGLEGGVSTSPRAIVLWRR